MRFIDYEGTVAADDADAVVGSLSLYGLAALDRDRYTIVGIDLEVSDDSAVTVYAVDRMRQGVSSIADIEQLGRDTGAIPVVAFGVPDPHVQDFVNHAFKRIFIRLLAREVKGQLLRVQPEREGTPPIRGAAAVR